MSETEEAVAEQAKEHPKEEELSLEWKIAHGALGFAIFVAAWEIASLLINNPIILPGPVRVGYALAQLLQDHLPPGAAGVSTIGWAIANTIELIAVGFAISLLGIPIGFAMGLWRRARFVTESWINGLYAIPMVALVPVFYVLLGTGFAADVAVVVFFTIFVIILNTYNGVRYVDDTLVQVGYSFGASRAQMMRHILFPASLPDIVAGLRLGLGRAVLGAVVAQALLSTNSLGFMMLAFNEITRTDYMVATVFIIAILGIAVLNLPKIPEKRLFRWKESERFQRGG